MEFYEGKIKVIILGPDLDVLEQFEASHSSREDRDKIRRAVHKALLAGNGVLTIPVKG